MTKKSSLSGFTTFLETGLFLLSFFLNASVWVIIPSLPLLDEMKVSKRKVTMKICTVLNTRFNVHVQFFSNQLDYN